MPVKKLLIGTSAAKEVYVGTSKVKLVYVGTSCVFASPRTVTISLGTGVSSVYYYVNEKDGSSHDGTLTSSGTVEVGYGAEIAFSATAATGYNLGSYTTAHTITENKTVSFTATLKTYTVTISKGTGVASATYTIYNAAGTATATGQTATTATVEHGGKITFTSVTASTGYALNSYTTTHTITATKTISLTAYYKTYTVTISKGTGVSTVTYTIYNESGTATATGQTATTATVRHNGKIKITGVTVATGYNTATYTAEHTITAAKTISVTTTYKTFTVTISKGTGVSTVYYDVWDENGTKTTTSGTNGTVTVRYNGKIKCTSATYSTGYEASSSDTTQYTITAAKTISWTAEKKRYTVTIQILYGSSVYTSKVGTVAGTYTNSSGTSTTLSATHGTSITVQHGGTVNLSTKTPVAGFAYSSGAGSHTITAATTIKVYFVASTSTSSSTLHYSSGTTTNTLSKNGFSVTCTINCTLSAVAANTSLATIPAAYRPASAQTVSVTWTKTNYDATTSATITIGTNGSVKSNTASSGTTTTAVGGGKWSTGATITTTTYLNFSKTWSV